MPKTGSRYALAVVLSVFGHLILLLWGSFGLGLGLDTDFDFELEFTEVEMLDPDAVQGEVEEVPEPAQPEIPPKAPDPDPETDAEGDDPAAEEDEEPEKPKPKFGDKRTKVDQLAPTSATFSMMLANKRIAGLPFADEAAEVMAPMPDFELLVDGAGFHPWKDFDFIILASPDIRIVSQTFLAVQYKLPREEVKAGIERAVAARNETIEWEMRGDIEMGEPNPIDDSVDDWDPRYFVLLPDEPVAMYVRPEFLDSIVKGPDASKGKTAGNFVANIARIRRFTRQEPKAGLQLKVKDLRRALKRARLPEGLEVPNDIEIMAEASKRPQVLIRLVFEEEAHAEKFEKFWRVDLKKIISKPRIAFFVGNDYRTSEVTVDGNSVLIRNRMKQERVEFILGILAGEARRMQDKSKAEMRKRAETRKALEKARQGGKLTPSEAMALEKAEPSGSPEPRDDPKKTIEAIPELPGPGESNDTAQPEPEPEPAPEPEPEPAPEPEPGL